jgi:hypothetical protein
LVSDIMLEPLALPWHLAESCFHLCPGQLAIGSRHMNLWLLIMTSAILLDQGLCVFWLSLTLGNPRYQCSGRNPMTLSPHFYQCSSTP